MYEFTGKSYLNLDAYVNIEQLIALHPYICLGIAKAEHTIGRYGPDILHANAKNFNNHIDNITIANNLTIAQRKVFNAYYAKIATIKVIDIRRSANYVDIDSSDKTVFDKNAEYFPELLEFIKTLPFSEIGRIIIFISETNQETLAHRDVPKNYKRGDFIWMSPQKDKKLYLYDEITNTKEYVTSHAAYFNVSDYHGVEAQPFPSYSIRVDGKFQDTFRKLVGLS